MEERTLGPVHGKTSLLLYSDLLSSNPSSVRVIRWLWFYQYTIASVFHPKIWVIVTSLIRCIYSTTSLTEHNYGNHTFITPALPIQQILLMEFYFSIPIPVTYKPVISWDCIFCLGYKVDVTLKPTMRNLMFQNPYNMYMSKNWANT